jgi:tetratricopeptide (TPR) repeat protein
MKKIVLLVLMFLISIVSVAQEFNFRYELNIAGHYKRYGFNDKAKECYIKVYHNPKTPKEIKSEALYLLGQIAYEEGEYTLAIEDWETLINDFPDSKETKEIDQRLPEIRETIFRVTKDQLTALDIASDFHRHKISEKAKEKFLTIYHDPNSNDEAKSQALYLLGQMAFEEGDYTVALEDWEILIERFPESKQTIEIANRLSQFREIITHDTESTIFSVVAKSYLNNGDFWSNAKSTFHIDYSWMPNVELAIGWYDKILKEFPQTNASDIAYRRKLFTLIGWKEPGREGESYGTYADFKQYMPQVMQTFSEYQTKYPKSQYLQGFRYQIAQVYWFQKDWNNAKIWLQNVIDSAHGDETFYSQTAKARLEKLKY